VLYRLRADAPAGLVPLAWAFVTAAHLGIVADRTLFVAHLVMDGLLVAFVALSWSDMTRGVLLAWRRVILAGIPVTLAGTAGLALPLSTAFLWVAVVGWMLLPAAGLVYTGLAVDGGAAVTVNLGGAALSLLGAVAYALGGLWGSAPFLAGVVHPAVPGLVLAGVGQTVGIVDAVFRY